jgi:carboxyl-terminal processing protease
MKRGPTIGMPTAGSTGQPIFIDLPGGGSARICNKRNIMIDGSEFIGKGIQPDRLVSESVVDSRVGVDAASEAALAEMCKHL